MSKQTQKHFGSVSDEFHDYWIESERKVHGGVYAKGLRKTKRPFDTKKPIHLVLKSSRAKGELSMLAPKVRNNIKGIIDSTAKNCDISLYKYSNNENHLHLILRAKHKEDFQKFLRIITGLIARLVLRAKKGMAKGKFWDALAFTRVAEWGQTFRNATKYVIQNILEAAGVIPYKPRNHRLVNLHNLRKQKKRIESG